MLKETETEETIGFVSSFLSLVAFQLEGAGPLGPPGYAYGFIITGQVCSHTNYEIWHNQTKTLQSFKAKLKNLLLQKYDQETQA